MMSNAEIVRLKNGVTDYDHSQGPEGAPATLLEYGNFECSDCRRAFPVIKEVRRVLNDSFRFIFRHFPNVRTHPHALRAAEAAEAASVQGKFWEMHDQLFTRQQALDDRDLSRYAARIGLDGDRFARDMVDKGVRRALAKASKERGPEWRAKRDGGVAARG
ncbi:MAG TPA: thioredoxin domain-containing protein [Pyrinomonadaceae bacterium]|nr:thioredoxin domain-containing protein [Pyrinomonadaceae bacterium]